MILRQTFVYPANAPGVLPGFGFPKRNNNYKIWSVLVNYDAAAVLVGNRVPSLIVNDGAGNTLCTFPLISTSIGDSEVGQILWAFGIAAASKSTGDGVRKQIPIPQDLWIQPQWSVGVEFDATGLGDILGPYILTSDETYGKTKNPEMVSPRD